MKKIILILTLIILWACDASAESTTWREGNRVIVKKGNTVVYKTPCGVANIINPLNVQRGGGILSGGADVEVLNTITVTYTNKEAYWTFGKPSLIETVKNFPMNDYELEFYKEGCSDIAYHQLTETKKIQNQSLQKTLVFLYYEYNQRG